MDLGLRGKVAIVSGSSRGIGKATAASLAAEGVSVVLNGRTAETLDAAAAELREHGATVEAVQADVMQADGCQHLVDLALARFGRVDILINNVGGGGADKLDSADAAWESAFDLTFWPALRLSRLVAPGMQRQRGGVIVMVASVFGRELGGRISYQVVKSAEISLAKALAKQLAPDNVRVLSIAPGSISFPGGTWYRRQQEDPAGMVAFVKQELPLGRFGRPEEVGDVIAFLCSDRASLVTGACVAVDGCQGRTLI